METQKMIPKVLKQRENVIKIRETSTVDVIMHITIPALIVGCAYLLNETRLDLLQKIFTFMGAIALLTIYLTIKMVMYVTKYDAFVPNTPKSDEETLNNVQRYGVKVFNRAGVLRQSVTIIQEVIMVLLVIYILLGLNLCILAWTFQTPLTIGLAAASLINLVIYAHYGVDMCSRSILLDNPNKPVDAELPD